MNLTNWVLIIRFYYIYHKKKFPKRKQNKKRFSNLFFIGRIIKTNPPADDLIFLFFLREFCHKEKMHAIYKKKRKEIIENNYSSLLIISIRVILNS